MSNNPSNWCPPQPNNPYDYSANPPVINPNQPPENLFRQPQDINVNISSICNTPFKPLAITGLLRDMLIRYFSRPENNPDYDIRKIVWRNSNEKDILIESVHRWNAELVGKRPAIFIKRNSYKSNKLTISNRMNITPDGHVAYTIMWIGSHTLFCINSTGASTEILATAVQTYLTEYGPLIVDYLNLFNFDVVEVGPVSEIEEFKESYVIPITVAWSYDQNWLLELESLKLRRIIMDFNVNGEQQEILK